MNQTTRRKVPEIPRQKRSLKGKKVIIFPAEFIAECLNRRKRQLASLMDSFTWKEDLVFIFLVKKSDFQSFNAQASSAMVILPHNRPYLATYAKQITSTSLKQAVLNFRADQRLATVVSSHEADFEAAKQANMNFVLFRFDDKQQRSKVEIRSVLSDLNFLLQTV